MIEKRVNLAMTIPTTYKGATLDPDHDWYNAMENELDSMRNLDVFELVAPTRHQNIVSSRWVYTLNKLLKGSPNRKLG